MSTSTPLRYWVDVAGRSFSCREVKGEERLSTPFRLDLRFVVSDGVPLDPADIVRKPATVRLERDVHVRSIEGLVTEVSVGAVKRGAPEVHLVIEPSLALLRHRTDIRLFRQKTVPEIVTEVLSRFGISPQLWLSRSYERREYCVQFRESDLDFVNRLLEDEGVTYYFLENGSMVLADSAAAYDSISGDQVIPFRGGVGMDRHSDAIISMGKRAALTTARVSLRDFNAEKPSLDMDVSAETGSPSGVEWYDFPGEYQDPAHGAKKAKLHAEAFSRAAAGLHGKTLSGRIFPGCKFTLALAPTGLDDGEYAVTTVRHAWSQQAGGFNLGFDAIEASFAYRPPRTTVAPQILNPVTGFVTGPAGEDIHTDEWGRVKVHFHWDRLTPMDGECSYWIPVLQDNTGHSCAMPRIGWEVLVHFLEGDPDRPVVLGRVYNATDEFPEVLPVRKTRSALKSHSSPSRVGMNQIRFDDLAGAEEINIHAERDQNVIVVNNKTEKVEDNESRLVKRDEQVKIGNNHTEKIGGDRSFTVGNDQRWTVVGTRKRSVAGADAGSITGNRKVLIAGSHNLRLTKTESASAPVLVEKVGAVILETSIKGNGTEVGMAAALTVGGAVAEVAKSQKSELANLARVETIGGLVYSQSDVETTARIGKRRITTVGAMFKMAAKKQMTLIGVKRFSSRSATGLVKADKAIMLKVGETTLAMKDGLIEIKTRSKITITVSGEGKLGADTSTQI
jgi:type VI secretion system secreted protein VgrG